MIWFILALVHIGMSSLCAYLYARKCEKLGFDTSSATSRLLLALCGGWIIVPELWDNSWMDKYGDGDNG